MPNVNTPPTIRARTALRDQHPLFAFVPLVVDADAKRFLVELRARYGHYERCYAFGLAVDRNGRARGITAHEGRFGTSRHDRNGGDQGEGSVKRHASIPSR